MLDRDALLRRAAEGLPGVLLRYELRPDGADRFPFVGAGVEALGLTPAAVEADAGALWRLVEDRDAVRRGLREAGRALAPWSQDLLVLVGRERRWLRAVAACEGRGPDGVVAWNGALIDVTARRRAELELERVEQVDGLVGRLAGGVAHEFNNLLTVVLGGADALAARVQGDPIAAREVELVRGAARRGADVVRRLLAFSRGAPSQPRTLDLHDLLQGFEPWLRRAAGDAVEVRLDLLAGVAAVRVDAALLEQVLLNLVVNARDAMPGGGRVVVSTSVGGGEVELRVADTGAGMTPEVLARCFEPFFTTKAVGEGTGLGLASCEGIIRQLGGTISAASPGPGAGATLTVRLPLAAGALDPPPAPAGVAPGAVPAAGVTVLVVEDEPSVRAVLAGALRGGGAVVHEAEDGEAALALARGLDRLDLLVTDVVMPRMGGPELAMCLRSLWRRLPIVFVSGHDPDALAPSADGPNVAFLPKPFTPDALRRAVEDVLAATP